MWLVGDVLVILPGEEVRLLVAETRGKMLVAIAEVDVPEWVTGHNNTLKEFIQQFACRHKRNTQVATSLTVLLRSAQDAHYM